MEREVTQSTSENALHRPVRRGEIYWIALESSSGPALAIAHPHVVVQDDLFNASRIATTVVCGITTNPKRACEPGTVVLAPGEGGLERPSVVLASQISSVRKSELGERIGELSEESTEQILSSLRFLQRAFMAGRTSGAA